MGYFVDVLGIPSWELNSDYTTNTFQECPPPNTGAWPAAPAFSETAEENQFEA